MSSSRTQLEAWLKTIDVPACSVLDVGGAQKPVRGRTRSWLSEDYKILDLPEPHERAESVKRIDIPEDIQGLPFLREGYFDIAFCLEVSEYWYRPLGALMNIAKALKRGGILYISFHAVYPPHAPKGKDYLRYTLAGAMKLLEEAGFGEIGVVSRVPLNEETLLDFYQLEGMKALDSEQPEATGWLIKCVKK